MTWQLITPPAQEPVSLAEIKQHLRIDHDEDDALIGALVSTARETAESLTGRQFVTARWRHTRDAFPSLGESLSQAIWLNKTPVQSVIGIEYRDAAGVWQELAPALYTLDLSREPACMMPVFGVTWPLTLPQIASVVVTVDAGFGGPSDVPQGIKSWIKLRVGSLYAHREEMALLTKGRLDPLPFVDQLLDPYRVVVL